MAKEKPRSSARSGSSRRARRKELKDRMAKERQEATAAAAATAAARTNSAGATVGSAGSGGAAAGASIPGSGSSGSLNTMVRQAAAGKQPAAPARAPVNQRTLVYVMGLSPRIAREEILRRHEYFGQYGKVLKIVITHTPQSAASGPVSLSSYITYSNREEAEQAILAVDGVVLDGRTLKASFGTPAKYGQLVQVHSPPPTPPPPASPRGAPAPPRPRAAAPPRRGRPPPPPSAAARAPPSAATSPHPVPPLTPLPLPRRT